MLRYYSYYSVGGYKDLMLGDSLSKDEATFFLPLLPVLEERAKTDPDAARQVDDLKTLPTIKQLSAENSYGLPTSAKTLFSHAGYKLIYKHLEGNQYALAIRDISPKSNDETGRSIPFLFVITGDSNADVHTLDVIATYMACNIKCVEQLLSQMLNMDMEKNGLRFDLAKFNRWIKEIVTTFTSTVLPCISGGLKIHASQNKVALLLLPDGISKTKSISEQKLESLDVIAISQAEVISKEDPERLVNLLLSVSRQLQDEKERNKQLKKGLIAAGIGGFLIGSIIASCCHK